MTVKNNKALIESLCKYTWARIDENGDQNDSELPYEAADMLDAQDRLIKGMEHDVLDMGEKLDQAYVERDIARDEVQRLMRVLKDAKSFLVGVEGFKLVENMRTELTQLRKAVQEFLIEVEKSPARQLGSGIGGQTIESSMMRTGRTVTEYQLAQLEEAITEEPAAP